ncbi:MAG: Na+/H+ antiporter NhaC [Bacteriovoracaceae bacterium]
MSYHAKRPGLLLSLIPVLVLVAILFLNISIFKDSATLGPNQLALLMAALVAGVIGLFVLKVPYERIEHQVVHAIGLSMQANLILLVVGSLIGLWIFSGVVPAMIYYGIKLINPTWFLPVTCLVCCIVSSATGSSWSTGGTVGIALIGVGEALNIPTGMVAGAVISGSYFGDKMSPLSDTTNLAPAMAGTDVFSHVKYMVYTTVPSIILALIGFLILGLFYQTKSADLTLVNEVTSVIQSQFNISPILFLLPILVFVLVAKKVPALPALIIGCIGGAIFVLIFQQDALVRMLGENYNARGMYSKLIEVAHSGFKLETGNKVIDSLLSRGGMSSMLNTVWLILMAMVFGGVMEVTGMLEELAATILKMVKGTGSLITATISSCVVINLTASDQYLAIVVPGKMFKPSYDKFGLAPENLSRSLEDAGTLTSVLVPWNTCGAYFSTILGVSTGAYLPFCFFNLINPIMAIVVANLGWKIKKIHQEDVVAKVNVAPGLG